MIKYLILDISHFSSEIVHRSDYCLKQSQVGTPVLYHNGYRYGSKKSRLKDHKYWRCTSHNYFKCKATGQLLADGTLVIKGQHSHAATFFDR